MPYLQLDTPFVHSTDQKKRLAKRFGEIYSTHMESDIDRITIAVRELGEGGCWRCGPEDPRPAALLMCDIREGRSADQREALAEKLVGACKEILGLIDSNINVEFTQHKGDEMYHTMYGGLSDDWKPGVPDALE